MAVYDVQLLGNIDLSSPQLLLRPQGVLPRFRTLVQVPVGARGELLSCEASAS